MLIKRSTRKNFGKPSSHKSLSPRCLLDKGAPKEDHVRFASQKEEKNQRNFSWITTLQLLRQESFRTPNQQLLWKSSSTMISKFSDSQTLIHRPLIKISIGLVVFHRWNIGQDWTWMVYKKRITIREKICMTEEDLKLLTVTIWWHQRDDIALVETEPKEVTQNDQSSSQLSQAKP